jgi:DNA-binding MarR family transcriptional regulator
VKAASGKSGDTSMPRQQASVSQLVVRHIERTCRTVIDGRRAARALAEWAQQFSLSEAEFQLLWCLRSAVAEGLDQTRLSRALTTSPANVSTTVERLRTRGWICQQAIAGDRRRQCWRLTSGGQELLEEMVSAAAMLRFEPAAGGSTEADGGLSQEAAA